MVGYTHEGAVAVISIDRPEAKNAIDNETAIALQDAWQRFDADENALIGVLTGDESVFSAGADLKKDGP